MKSYMKDYIDTIDKYIKDKEVKNIDSIIEQHLIKISFFQHERLVHFIVTMLFAILTFLSFLYTIINISLGMCLLTILFVCLLIPYIIHYYFLENSVQYMYMQYDELIKKR